MNGIPKDNLLLYNPILYPIAIIAGTSLIITLIFAFSAWHLFAREGDKNLRNTILFFVVFLVLSFIARYLADTTFVRRASIFLPFIAMISGYGIVKFLRAEGHKYFNKTVRISIVLVSIFYTLALSLNSQYYFLFDTRYGASSYLNEHFSSGNTIAYSRYAKTNSMPDGIAFDGAKGNPDVIVLHEAYFRRYWRELSSPFEIPACCDEVYHCILNHCTFIQGMLSGKTDYKLVKTFQVDSIFPERIIYKHFFGTYETYIGDVLVFVKQKNVPQNKLIRS